MKSAGDAERSSHEEIANLSRMPTGVLISRNGEGELAGFRQVPTGSRFQCKAFAARAATDRISYPD